jgi:DNA-binding GntR family transcriptional regulator
MERSMEARRSTRLGPQQARVYLALQCAIDNGQLRAGQQLDNQAQLARQHGVALATLNQVLGLLEHEGYIVRRQGVGTFVAETPPAPANPLRALAQFTGREFSSSQAAAAAALSFQIGMHSAFLSRFDADELAILVDYDDHGCGIRAGASFPLEDAF